MIKIFRDSIGYSPFGTTSIGTDDDTVADVEVLTDPLEHTGLGVQVVDGHVEEALDLAGVEIHGDDMVAASSLKHVGHELGGNGSTTLVLLILAGVGEVGDDSSDATGRCSLAGVDHDE